MCSKEVIEKIQLMASFEHKEICGVILKDSSVLPITNVANKPNAFIFSKKEWYTLLNSSPDILCVYHSHLNGDPTPSKEDLACQSNIKYDFLIVAGSKWEYINA